MAPTPLVLRVLLILALVLNGIGSAVAGVHAHAAPMDAHQALDAAPCHDEAPAPAQDTLTPGTDECCDGARCDCACPAASATLAAIRLPLHAAPPATLAMHRLDAGHRAPALAHPIRPPIA